jgi:hypothetical protein
MANLIAVEGLPALIGCFHEVELNLMPGPSTPTKIARMIAAARIHPVLRVIAPAGIDELRTRTPEK